MTGQALLLRADAARLPLADASVDLIVTSPPYWALRSYTDQGTHYPGQIGSEPHWRGWLAAMLQATTEMARVLKPTGSLFVDLGDAYRDKGLLMLPERYRIACVDELELIARAVILWDKPNGLPESVTDRVRRSHEDWVHLVKQPRYYSAVDEIREPQVTLGQRHEGASGHRNGHPSKGRITERALHDLGKLPGSVWSIPTEPLTVPAHIGVDHYAAYPQEWPRRLILGWSPPGICVACGEGRRPVVDKRHTPKWDTAKSPATWRANPGDQREYGAGASLGSSVQATIRGYACTCTPSTDHPATGTTRRRGYSPGVRDDNAQGTYGRHQAGEYTPVGTWREYHLDSWTPPPTRPAVVLDPFAGTGTTVMVARALGRVGVGVDLSADYLRLARWRVFESGHAARTVARTNAERQTTLDLTEVTG